MGLLKEIKKKIAIKILPTIAYWFANFIYFTSKKEFKLENIPNEPVVVVSWHEEILMNPFIYRMLRKNFRAYAIVSYHSDGKVAKEYIKKFGIKSLEGSTNKGGVKVLLEAIRKSKDGFDIIITPDGPRGPRRSIADGVVALAKKNDLFIVPLKYSAKKKWRLNSWDKFVIPKPFGKLTFEARKAFKITALDEKRAKELIKEALCD